MRAPGIAAMSMCWSAEAEAGAEVLDLRLPIGESSVDAAGIIPDGSEKVMLSLPLEPWLIVPRYGLYPSLLRAGSLRNEA